MSGSWRRRDPGFARLTSVFALISTGPRSGGVRWHAVNSSCCGARSRAFHAVYLCHSAYPSMESEWGE